MLSTASLIDDCIDLLSQAAIIISSIDDRAYTHVSPLSPDGTVGSHTRHVLDFFRNFLEALGDNTVKYNIRDRASAIQINRQLALVLITKTSEQLRAVSSVRPDASVSVLTENDGRADVTPTRSSVARELEFLRSHTIHHYAVIALLLRLQAIEPGREFGVAPSTLIHLSKESACAQ